MGCGLLGVRFLKELFELAPIFSDYMVFQANKPIRVFGTCKKGAEIIITFPHQEVKIKTKEETFSVEISAMDMTRVGFAFSVSSKKQKTVLYNCLVGEVFFIAGACCAAFPLKEGYLPVIREYPMVRFLSIPRSPYENAHEEFPELFQQESKWKILGPEYAPDFSAFGFHLASFLRDSLSSPIGIVLLAEPETSMFSFVSENEILKSTKLRRILISYQKEIDKFDSSQHYDLVYEQEMGYAQASSKLSLLPMGPKHHNRPSGMYSVMNRYLKRVSFAGAIYYQGTTDLEHVDLAEEAIWRMVSSWRTLLDLPNLPFFHIQLAGRTLMEDKILKAAKFREAQAKCMDISDAVYMTSAVDLGDKLEPISRDQLPLAERMANLILEKVYHIGKNSMCPMIFSHQIQKEKLLINTHQNSLNLMSRSRQNTGFYQSYDGITFEEIQGVQLMTNQIAIPYDPDVIEIRYGYHDFPMLDLYSANGLPLLPFRLELEKEAH